LIFRVPSDHPALPGHFPGRPIVPGVLLLDAVMQEAAAIRADPPTRLLRAKFPAPVLPGDAIEITFDPRGPDRLAFTCRHACSRGAGTIVLLGELGWPTPP
jgi:3-hydroxymyristoyl/3-hydroxydecanoyl-(acyl carrier protein) dehydratase